MRQPHTEIPLPQAQISRFATNRRHSYRHMSDINAYVNAALIVGETLRSMPDKKRDVERCAVGGHYTWTLNRDTNTTWFKTPTQVNDSSCIVKHHTNP